MREENGFKLEEIKYVPYIPDKYEFKKYFDSMRKIDCEDGVSKNKRIRHTYTYKELSEITGAPEESIRKLINKTQPTSNRDLIISLCIAIKLDLESTNLALRKYGMSELYDGSYGDSMTRDYLLMEILDKYSGDMTLHEVNNHLVASGFSPLHIPIIEKEIAPFSKQDEYEVINIRVFPLINGYDFCLSEKFNIKNYDCSAEMLIKNLNSGEKYIITGSKDKKFLIHSLSGSTRILPIEKFEHYKNLKTVLSFLVMKIDKEIYKLRTIQNDTKNYGNRTTAKFEDGRIVFISESFNNKVPEIPLYILVEDDCKDTKILISNKSMFMSKLYDDIQYREEYHCEKIKAIWEYNNVDDIKDDAIYKNHEVIQNSIIKICNDLISNISKLKDDIKYKKEFISSSILIDGEPDEFYLMCRAIKLVKEFSFKKDGEFYYTTRNKITYRYNDKIYIITREDVKTACELGMKNANDICSVKERIGSLEALYEEM